jgi:hypothetical protein
MKAFKLSLCLAILLLSVRPAAAAECTTLNNFCGPVFMMNTPFNTFAPAGTVIDYCNGQYPSVYETCFAVTTACDSGTMANCHTYAYGSHTERSDGCIPSITNPLSTYYLRPRRTADDYGQEGVSIAIAFGMPYCSNGQPNLFIPPAPHRPNIVYPANNQNVIEATFDVKWQDGLDAFRNNARWPVKYTVFLKSWAYGANEPVGKGTVIYKGACIPTGTNQCRTSLSALPAAVYRVYVDVALDVSAEVDSTLRPAIYTNTDSNVFVIQSGRPPGCCR